LRWGLSPAGYRAVRRRPDVQIGTVISNVIGYVKHLIR
jgi:hypothetical protein